MPETSWWLKFSPTLNTVPRLTALQCCRGNSFGIEFAFYILVCKISPDASSTKLGSDRSRLKLYLDNGLKCRFCFTEFT